MVTSVRARVERAKDRLSASAAEGRERPRSLIVRVAVVRQLVRQAASVPRVAAIELRVQLVDALSRLEVNEIRPFVLIGVDRVERFGMPAFEHVVELGVQAFWNDVVERLLHRRQDIVRVVRLDKGGVAHRRGREGPVTASRLQVLARRP